MTTTASHRPLRVARPAPRPPVTLPWGRADTLSFLVVGLLAALTRFVGLGGSTSSGTPVFDEKHYVPQAWDMVLSGDNPVTGGIESNPGFGLVVHPPVAKQLIALGEHVFGYSPWGWRVVGAAFGVGVVLATMGLARQLSASRQVALIAGVLTVFDGVLLVGSRFGMLDIFQVLFIVLAAWALVNDHKQVHARLHAAWAAGPLAGGTLGPRMGFRWWRFAAGVLLGLACGVKWSGLYYIAFFGLTSVGADALLRRRYGVRSPWWGALLRDAAPALASLVLVPLLVYVWSWRAWFASETSVYRHAAEDGSIEPDSLLNLLPDGLAGWLYYHRSVLDFHAGLTTSSGHSHPWDSKPWSWLVSSRPILYLSADGVDCAVGECRRMIFLFGTPAIWWLTIPALLWGLWCLVVRRDARYAVPLIGFAAGFLPWLAAYDRQMYFFYAEPLAPFIVLLIALAAAGLIGAGRPLRWRAVTALAGRPLRAGTFAVVCYLSVVVAMFIYFGPILYGTLIPEFWYQQLMWLPSWH